MSSAHPTGLALAGQSFGATCDDELEPAGYLTEVAQLGRLGHWIAGTGEGLGAVREVQREARAAERRGSRRALGYRLQRALRPIFDREAPSRTGGLSPMTKCHWTRYEREGFAVHVSADGRASFGGLVSCKRRSCPHCGPALLARDAELVEAGVREHGYERAVMATMTVRHWSGLPLRGTRRGIVDAWADLQRQRAFKRFLACYGAKVFVRVLEVTHGESGWHVHYHVLVLLGRDLGDDELRELDTAWSHLWRASVTRAMGRAHRPTLDAGAKLTRCYRADYLTKLGIGAEVADVGQAKRGKGRTYWRMATEWVDAGADQGAPEARLLGEYIRDMRGAVIVAWPREGRYTRAQLAERHPEEKPERRESAHGFAEEWDELRRRELDGVEGRLFVLRAAEAAAVGEVQRAVDEAIVRLFAEGTGRALVRATSPPSLDRAAA